MLRSDSGNAELVSISPRMRIVPSRASSSSLPGGVSVAKVMSAERVRTARSLLLQAVESLDDSKVENESRSLARQSSTSARRLQQPAAQPASMPEQGSSALLRERNRLFNFGFRRRNLSKSALNPPTKSKKKKLHSTWCHDFVCLAHTTATKPLTSLQIADLMRAGLGRKQLTLFEGDGSVEVHTEIMQSFPSLQGV